MTTDLKYYFSVEKTEMKPTTSQVEWILQKKKNLRNGFHMIMMKYIEVLFSAGCNQLKSKSTETSKILNGAFKHVVFTFCDLS